MIESSNMKKILLLIALPFILSGCGLFKARTVNKVSGSFSQIKTADLSTDSSIIEIDKSVTIETKKGDSVFKIPEKKTKTETPFDWSEIIEGLTFVDSSLNSFTIRIDTNEKKLFTELVTPGKDLHLSVDESKATYNDKSRESTRSSQEKRKEATEARSDIKATEAKPKWLFWLWAIIAAVIVAVFWRISYYFIKQRKSPV